MLTCKELTELVTDYVEGRLPFSKRLSFRLHIGMCAGCRAYVRQMKVAIRLAGAVKAEPPSPQVRDELLRRFRDWKP